MEERKGRRILLFPLPLQGHITPMLQLAQILHSNGFSITIIHTHFNSPNPSNYPHFTFCPIPDGLDQSERAMADVISIVSLLNSRCQDPLEKCLEKLKSEEENEAIGCLVSDAVFHFTQGVAERVKIPRVVLRTGGACSFRVFAAFNLLREKGYLPIQDSQLEQQIEELPPLKVKDLPVPIISNSDPQIMYQLADSMVMSTKKSSGLIFNSFDDLEQPSLTLLRHEFPCPIFPVGPFHTYTSNPSTRSSLLSEDDSCIAWLDKQAPRSVIYVSFGSIASVTDTEFNEIAWGLRNSGRPFLWVVRPGSVSNLADDPGMVGLEEKGLVVKWAPQMEVLAHPSVSAFWTHCGWNSTLEGISEGVPLICMPCFTDQKVNSRFVCDVWKVGLELQRDGIDRGKIESIIRRLVEEKEGEEIRSRMLAMKKKASDGVRVGGSSQKSIESLVHHILSLESFTFCS